MNRRRIDETISTTSTTTGEVEGRMLAQPGDGLQMWAAAQCERVPATGNYEVVLEQALVSESGTMNFGTIVKFNQKESGMKPVNFPVNASSRYRFRHVSGASCKVVFA